jgi:ABC-type transporter Mla subunit MlaD
MKKKHITAMSEDLAASRKQLGRVRATIAHLLDDSDVVKGKTWKRLNKIYQTLDNADRELSSAQAILDEAMPKLLKQFDK